MRLAVTTSFDPRPSDLAEARAAAGRLTLPFAVRERRSLAEVAADTGAEALLVLARTDVSLFVDGRERRWQPGMGALRAKRLRLGERETAEPFLEAAGVVPGESVLDCTLGLGGDALVAAVAVGPRGRVVGLESSEALAALTAEGLRRLPDEAARRIEVRHGEAGASLAALPGRSFDLVTFDPMFRHPRAEPPGFDLVRRLGDARPLEAKALGEARRVARRAVLVKDGSPGWDLTRLGLVPLPSARGAKRVYARIEV